MKAAIFDLDGTLLDSMGIWQQIDVEFLGKRGIPLPDDYFDAVTTMHFMTAAEYTIKRFGFSQTPEQVVEEWRQMALSHYSNTVPLKPFVKEYLDHLRQTGVRIAAATASEDTLMQAALTRHGIYDYFETIVYAAEVKRGKGFPDIYEEAATRLGVDIADCWVFEDILAGVKGAKDGAFYAVGVQDDAAKKDQAAMQSIADLYIDSFQQLLP